MRGRVAFIASILSTVAIPGVVFGQAATIVSDREPIVVYDESS